MTAKDLSKEVGVQILHALIAMAVLAPVMFMPVLIGAPISGYLYALVREDTQHRKHFDKTPEGWGWFAKGFPFGGRHRDMYAGALGGAINGIIHMAVT